MKEKKYYYEVVLLDINNETHVYILYDLQTIKRYIDFAIEKNQKIKSIKLRKEA